MIDGIEVGEHMVLVALGIDEAGQKQPLGLWLGVTENAIVCGELLNNLATRGLDPQQPYLFVIDGGKRLRRGGGIAAMNRSSRSSGAVYRT